MVDYGVNSKIWDCNTCVYLCVILRRFSMRVKKVVVRKIMETCGHVV
jgi:hypothetical protein